MVVIQYYENIVPRTYWTNCTVRGRHWTGKYTFMFGVSNTVECKRKNLLPGTTLYGTVHCRPQLKNVATKPLQYGFWWYIILKSNARLHR
jgi:hypothetical protein